MKRMQMIAMLAIAMLVAGSAGTKAQINSGNNQQQKEIEVSDSELKLFARVMGNIQQASNEIMVKVIQDHGLDLNRYRQIAMAKSRGQKVDMTSEEKQAYQSIQNALKQQQPKMRKKADSIIQSSEMKKKRYGEILSALRTDTELQKRLRAIRKQQ
jgi:hypothetical protein